MNPIRRRSRPARASSRRCLLLQGDVVDPAWCREAVRRTVEAFGRLDVLVNNAAFQQHGEDLDEIDEARFEKTVQTNIGGCFRMARAALPHLKPGGSVINTGSVTGLEGSEKLLDHAATEAAIHPAATPA